MDLIYPRCAAIDIHKKLLVACAGWFNERGRHRVTRTFGSMTQDIERMVEWFEELGVTHVAMEATGVYWKPVYNLLEDRFQVVLANAAHVKGVPGRKTDVKDAEWLQELLAHGLIRGSFIPPAQIRELRELTRYRKSIIEERSREVNRVQKLLEDANIKLGSVATDVLGVSGREILRAIVDGVDDAKELAEHAKGRLRNKRAELVLALHGRVLSHHRMLLRELLDHIEYLDRSIERLDAGVEARMRPLESASKLLCSIDGVGPRVAEVIIAEIGTDMSRFPSAKHLCSWAAICPGNYESAGKRLKGTTRHGNRWLRGVLLQAAWAATRVKDGYLGAQFRQIAKRRGAKRAAVAVAHSILTIVYNLLHNGVYYENLGADYFERKSPDQLKAYHLRRLIELGCDVTIQHLSAA